MKTNRLFEDQEERKMSYSIFSLHIEVLWSRERPLMENREKYLGQPVGMIEMLIFNRKKHERRKQTVFFLMAWLTFVLIDQQQ